MMLTCFRGGFKTQPPVDRRFRPVPGGCHCLEQKKPGGTGRNRRSTGGWVLKPSLSHLIVFDIFLLQSNCNIKGFFCSGAVASYGLRKVVIVSGVTYGIAMLSAVFAVNVPMLAVSLSIAGKFFIMKN